MEINKITSKLIYNNKIIQKNFEFRLTKQIGNLIEIGKINIKKDYFEANNFNPQYKDKIKILMSINNEKEHEIFDGIILNCIKSKTEYIINAEDEISFKLSELANTKSYINTTANSILNEICDYLDFDPKLNILLSKFIVLDIKKRFVILTLLKTIERIKKNEVYYYIENKKLNIKSKLEGKIYKIDDFIINSNENKINIFPLPELNLEDKISYKNKEYSIKTITMTNRKFIIEVI
ncbi:MAG: hypothetical protein QXL18_04425 [Candidatus Woesearchaeota archaeon]